MRGLRSLPVLTCIWSGFVSPALLANPLPDLTILTLQTPSDFTNGPNPVITVQWAVTNQGGPVPANSYWYDSFYLSATNILESSATLLFSSGWSDYWLASGAYGETQLVDLPLTNNGVWYLHLRTDDGNSLAELDESNNVATVRLAATILPPDLKPLALISPPAFSGPPVPYVQLAWGVTNQGPGPANGLAHRWTDLVFVSTNSYLDGTEQNVGYSFFSDVLAPGASYWVTNKLRLPLVNSGKYYLILQISPGNNLLESDTNNNTISVPMDFQVTPPDLKPILFQASANFTGSPNPSLTFVWGVTNQGTGPAVGQIGSVYGSFDGWLDTFYVSTNAVFDATARGIGSWMETNVLAPGASYYRTNAFTVPVVASGTYYFFLITDEFNDLMEPDFNNNTATTGPMTCTILPPDLAPLPLVVPTVVTGAPGTVVTIIAGVTNQGIGSAINPLSGWFDRLELWTGPGNPGNFSTLLGQWQRTDPLPAGASYWLTNIFTIPDGGGQFLLVFTTDDGGNQFESNETNNVVTSPLTLVIPPRLENPSLAADGSFWATALGTLGFNYRLQTSSNLVDWLDVSTLGYSYWPMYVTDPSGGGHPQRFYRLAPAANAGP